MSDAMSTNKVDITVAGHTVIVESAEPMDRVAAKALELFRATEQAARRIPVGFAAAGLHADLADPPLNGHDPAEWAPA